MRNCTCYAMLNVYKHTGDAEWLSRNTDGPDNPDHWGPLDRALPAAAVAALGRRWGWHRIVYAAKPAA